MLRLVCLLLLTGNARADFMSMKVAAETGGGDCSVEVEARFNAMLCGGVIPSCKNNTRAAGDDQAYVNPKGWCESAHEDVAKTFPQCSLSVQNEDNFESFDMYCKTRFPRAKTYSAVLFVPPMDEECPAGSQPSADNVEGTRKCAIGLAGKPCCVCKDGYKNGDHGVKLRFSSEAPYIQSSDACRAVECPTTNGKVVVDGAEAAALELPDGSANPACACPFGKIGRIEPSADQQGWVSTCKWADAGTSAVSQSWITTYGPVDKSYEEWKDEMDGAVSAGLLSRYLKMYNRILKEDCHIPAATTVRTRKMTCWYPKLQGSTFTYAYVRHDITRGKDCSSIESTIDGEYPECSDENSSEEIKALQKGDSPAWDIPMAAAQGIGNGWTAVLGEVKSTYMTDSDISRLAKARQETALAMLSQSMHSRAMMASMSASKSTGKAVVALDAQHSQWICTVNVEITNEVPLDDASASGESPQSTELTRILASLNTEQEICAARTAKFQFANGYKKNKLPGYADVSGVLMTTFDLDGSKAGNTQARTCNRPTTKKDYADLNNAYLGTSDVALVNNDKACRCLKGQFGILSPSNFPTEAPADSCKYQVCPSQKFKNQELVEGMQGGNTFESGCQCTLGWFNNFGDDGHPNAEIPPEWGSSSAMNGEKLYYRSITYKKQNQNTESYPCFRPCPLNAGPSNPLLLGYVEAETADCKCNVGYVCKFVQDKPDGCLHDKPQLSAGGNGWDGSCVELPKSGHYMLEAPDQELRCAMAGQKDEHGKRQVIHGACNADAPDWKDRKWKLTQVRYGKFMGENNYQMSVEDPSDGKELCLRETADDDDHTLTAMTLSSTYCSDPDSNDGTTVFTIEKHIDADNAFTIRGAATGKKGYCWKRGDKYEIEYSNRWKDIHEAGHEDLSLTTEARCYTAPTELSGTSGEMSLVWALRPYDAESQQLVGLTSAKYNTANGVKLIKLSAV